MAKKKQKTPLMRQYDSIKEKYPGTILLFRVGDFYETFGDDAELISRELGITLTKRNNGGDQTPLAGFPYHAVDNYLPKLVKRGFRVAICEQTENPEEAKKAGRKIVDRDVTEITTPGVTLSDKLLDHKRNNYIAAVWKAGGTYGVAFSDVSTGEFSLCQVSAGNLHTLVQSLQPSELLLPKKWKNREDDTLKEFTTTWVEDWVYEGEYGYKTLTDHFQTHSLKGYGVDDLEVAHVAAGALLHYVRETQKSSLGHLKRLQAYENSDYMALDAATKRNLELISTMQEGGSDGTLISILDDTCTAMGGRMLRKWIMRPQKKIKPIEQRLDAVQALHADHERRSELREELQQVGDLERLISRISVGRTNARDIRQLQRSLAQIPRIKMQLNGFENELLGDLNGRLKTMASLQERIDAALV
ncbi:MAG: DNA mismatch repair protein MutS, partial [Balneolaceae bacterium]